MYLKQLAAFGMSAVMMLSGGVVASGAETKNDSETTLVTPYEYSAAVETLAASGVAAGSATALQAADGLRLAQESGALEESESSLSLTELAAQALIRETEELQKQNFLAEYDGVLTTCENYITLRAEPDQDAAALRTIWAGKVAHLIDVENDDWYKVSYGSSTGYVMAQYCEPVHYADYEGTYATSTLVEDIIAFSYTYLGTPYRYGGTSYSGIDCSGFTMKVFAQFGISLPHGATGQYALCTPVTTAERAPGDLVFFNTSGRGIGTWVSIWAAGSSSTPAPAAASSSAPCTRATTPIRICTPAASSAADRIEPSSCFSERTDRPAPVCPFLICGIFAYLSNYTRHFSVIPS